MLKDDLKFSEKKPEINVWSNQERPEVKEVKRVVQKSVDLNANRGSAFPVMKRDSIQMNNKQQPCIPVLSKGAISI